MTPSKNLRCSAVLIPSLMFLLLWGPSPLDAQENRLETALFDCLKDAYPDQGAGLDSLMAVYENELVAQGHLENRTSAAYFNLMQRLASGKRLTRDPAMAFDLRLSQLPPMDSVASLDCQKTLMVAESQLEGSVQLALFERMLFEQPVDAGSQLLATRVLDVLQPADFEFPLYRLQTYWILDRSEYQETGLEPGLVAGGIPSDGPNTLRLYFTQEAQILIDNVRMDPEWVLQRIERHFRAYAPDAVFVVDVDPDLRYREYIRVQDRILGVVNQVRSSYALRRFGRTLSELTKAEKLEVDAAYPIHVIFPRN